MKTIGPGNDLWTVRLVVDDSSDSVRSRGHVTYVGLTDSESNTVVPEISGF